MFRQLLIAALILIPFAVYGGGEVPFPLEGDNALPVLESRSLHNSEINLTVQIRVYQSLDGGREAKIWVRGADGFVWDRVWLKVHGDILSSEVELGQNTGTMIADLKAGGQLFIGGRIFTLEKQN